MNQLPFALPTHCPPFIFPFLPLLFPPFILLLPASAPPSSLPPSIPPCFYPSCPACQFKHPKIGLGSLGASSSPLFPTRFPSFFSCCGQHRCIWEAPIKISSQVFKSFSVCMCAERPEYTVRHLQQT